MYALGGMGFAMIGFGGAAFAMQVCQEDAGKILAKHARNAPWPKVYEAFERFGGTSEVGAVLLAPIVCELYVRMPGTRGMLDPMVGELLKGHTVEVAGPDGAPMVVPAADFVRQAIAGQAPPEAAAEAEVRAEAEARAATPASSSSNGTDPVGDTARDAAMPTEGPAQ